MKNLWNDAEAEDLVEQLCDKGRRPRPGAARLHDPAARRRSAPGAAWRRQHLGQDQVMADLVGDEWDVLCVKGSGWDMGVIEPQGLPAVKLGAAAQGAQAADTLSGRGHGRAAARQPDRPVLARTRRSRRCCTPSCRTNSSTTPIRPPILGLDRPGQQQGRSARRSSARRSASCLHHARASTWPRQRRRGLRAGHLGRSA